MKNTRLVIVVSALVLLIAACGGKSAEEELLEQILENEDLGNVDVNLGNDDEFNLNFEGEGGEDVSVSGGGSGEDFEITIEGEDGESMTIGSGDIPPELTFPSLDGGSVGSTFVTGSDVSVVLQYPQSQFDQLVEFYDSSVDGERNESTFSSEDGTFRNVFYYSEDGAWNVIVADCVDFASGEFDAVCVTLAESLGE